MTLQPDGPEKVPLGSLNRLETAELSLDGCGAAVAGGGRALVEGGGRAPAVGGCGIAL